MSLTIHYKGRFKEGASLPGMIMEVKDIADIYRWDYHIFETVFPEDSPDHPPPITGQCDSFLVFLYPIQ